MEVIIYIRLGTDGTMWHFVFIRARKLCNATNGFTIAVLLELALNILPMKMSDEFTQ